jgi:hypothetical protein
MMNYKLKLAQVSINISISLGVQIFLLEILVSV